MHKIVTTFHAAAYRLYGKNMIHTFDTHWPKDVELHVYYEGDVPKKGSDRVKFIDLLKACPDLVAFKNEYHDDPIANGKIGTSRHKLIRRDDDTKHIGRESFLWDAVRFSHKVFCQIHAATCDSAETMFWIDADTITFRDVDDSYKQWINPATYCSYLGRATYTETGFIGYNLIHSANQEFMTRYGDMYRNGGIFELEQWTDCHAFDHVREQMEAEGKMVNTNINNVTRLGHPFINSCVGEFMDHLKGPRKMEGKSRPKDVIDARGIEYWERL